MIYFHNVVHGASMKYVGEYGMWGWVILYAVGMHCRRATRKVLFLFWSVQSAWEQGPAVTFFSEGVVPVY
jgi:hypothetical protein